MNMQAMLKQAQALQKDMMKIKNEIDETEFVGESSMVKVTMKGTREAVKVEIDFEDSLDKDDIEMLQDLILTATNCLLFIIQNLRNFDVPFCCNITKVLNIKGKKGINL